MTGWLSRESTRSFHDLTSLERRRYLILPDFFSKDTSTSLLQRSKDLIAGFDIDQHPMTRFATGESDHVGDDYFLSSGDKASRVGYRAYNHADFAS